MTQVVPSNPIAMHAWETARTHVLHPRSAPPGRIAAWQSIEAIGPWLRQAVIAAQQCVPATSTAGEWLLDNAYQIQRAMILISQDMPPGFYRRLRALAYGKGPGDPRVLAIAHDLLHTTHFQLTRENVLAYLDGYQAAEALEIAELWALPVMLRLASLELLTMGFGHAFPSVPSPFAASHSCLVSMNTCDPVECVSRSIANLGVISNISWKDVFDAASAVEAILLRDPAGTYRTMDFETRNACRQVIEQLSVLGHASEVTIATTALSLAQGQRLAPANHVGYWLIGDGLIGLEHAVRISRGRRMRVWRALLRRPAMTYFVALFLCGLVGLVFPAAYLFAFHATLLQWILGLAATGLPATVFSITIVNWIITQTVPPRRLPKLDFSDGIASDWPTVVVMPVIISDADEVPDVLDRLEAHKLANPDACAFVLLSDPHDASQEVVSGDSQLEDALQRGIEALNLHHAGAVQGGFILLHRRRVLNSAQGCWMAWERKRGKLEQFNHFLLEGDSAAFPVTAGRLETLQGVRFVVTGDADTRFPPGSVAQLAGTLAHPLNRPVFDSAGKVVSGYTVLQPRIELTPHGDESRFARLFGGDCAIDIYSRAVSDVYQDLIGTGSYAGKGIYDLAAFVKSLSGRVPENQLLSHDLWEGLHGRAGLVSDVVVYESFPATYGEYAQRWHRWVRGDWQLSPWLFNRVPGPDGIRLYNRLTIFDRLRIWDTMRRSLVPPSVVLLLVAGWFWLPGSPLVWTAFALLIPGAWLFTDLVTGLARGRRRGVLPNGVQGTFTHLGRWLLQVTFLVSDAAIALHAISLTLFRLNGQRRLLEWTSAAHSERKFARQTLRSGQWRVAWPSPVIAVLVLSGVAFSTEPALGALPILFLWLAAPEIAVWAGRRRELPVVPFTAKERLFLRHVARRSWLFFERFVRPEGNWLPSDNHQEEPEPATAHRTSPTNIGMMVLAAISAWRMGHIGTRDLVERMRAMLDTTDRLERWHGHLLNWYDTRTLAPLEPRYASTVDSGNLAASLVTLAQGCREITCTPPFSAMRWDGLEDCLSLLAEAFEPLKGFEPVHAQARRMLGEIAEIRQIPRCWPTWIDRSVDEITSIRQHLAGLVMNHEQVGPRELTEMRDWCERTEHHLRDCQRDLAALLPWLRMLAEAPREYSDLALRLEYALTPEIAMADARLLGTSLENVRIKSNDAGVSASAQSWLTTLTESVGLAQSEWRRLEYGLLEVSRRAQKLTDDIDFTPLFDRQRKLFHIGFDVSANRVDGHYYDLLASEARLASYLAIARRTVPTDHWMHLGRPIVKHRGKLALVSWNGSMFEYLMPLLLQRSDHRTLLGESARSAVSRQQRYAARHKVPWGISESGFAALGPDGTWRYRAFGVPELGLRRDLQRDMVIAPYATALALAVDPAGAVENLRRLAEYGALRRFGFYEALDFTAERRESTGRPAPVSSYMSHHHGMSIAAIANALHDNVLVNWFQSDHRIASADLLLNERIPRELPPELQRHDLSGPTIDTEIGARKPEAWLPPSWPRPIGLLGNGRMSLRLAGDGSGDLEWREQALTRPWERDPNCGHFLHLRIKDSDKTLFPVGRSTCASELQFYPHKVDVSCEDAGVAVSASTFVAATDDVEVRRVRIVNKGAETVDFEFASHAEIALAGRGEWSRHPQFARLFVASEPLGADGLLFTHRARNPNSQPLFFAQRLLLSPGSSAMTGRSSCRSQTISRMGDSLDFPHFDKQGAQTLRYPLDCASAFCADITLLPETETDLAVVTAVARSRDEVIDLLRRYGSFPSLDWAEQETARQTMQLLGQLGIAQEDLPDITLLQSVLLGASVPQKLHEGSSPARDTLWRLALSGDHPVLCTEIGAEFDVANLRLLLSAHRFWRVRNIPADLVILHPGRPGYVDQQREQLIDIIRAAHADEWLGQRGGIHVFGLGELDGSQRSALDLAAAITIKNPGAPISEQVAVRVPEPEIMPRFVPMAPTPAGRTDQIEGGARSFSEPLSYENGFGGFDIDGNYLVQMGTDTPVPGHLPAPWTNVIANRKFGTVVSESGLGFTFCENSGENRLTPWHNDPLLDPQGEVIYLRDEETGAIWSTTPLPAGRGTCSIRHGLGETRWTSLVDGLDHELHCFVAEDDPVKVMRLRVVNQTDKLRRVTATCFVDWILGAITDQPAPFRNSAYRPDLQAILGRNFWSSAFGGKVAFLTILNGPVHSLTTSRAEFLGISPDWQRPAGLVGWDLGDRISNQGDDAIAALQLHLEIRPGETIEATFLQGEVDNEAELETLLARWRMNGAVDAAHGRIVQVWNEHCGKVEVHTPDPAFDLMVNRWLPYQALSSRLLARTGYYQSSGAFGFRDQLQDVLGFLLSDPALARTHILRAAGHQFAEGDVLHWWHPPGGEGVRTRCSDDLLWLPFVTARYVLATGDFSVLQEQVPFLHAAELREDEHDRFDGFPAYGTASLWDHCTRALNRSWRLGAHDLPLIGDGDWNDGLNKVGAAGQGESVWLAWFQAATIREFARINETWKEQLLEPVWKIRATRLIDAVEQHGWDGAWYVRAFDDQGRPWGATESEECQIDSIAQSWAVLSGGGCADRARIAIDSALQRLVQPDDQIVRLLDPPFDKTPRDPGYIKAYPPGVRENGGQYSHAAAWLGIACAMLRDGANAKVVFDRINPIRQSSTQELARKYAIEPYVVAGDICAGDEQPGRGGWSWYTGAAAWTWQLGVEYILGIKLEAGRIALSPCLPPDWSGFSAMLRGDGDIEIVVRRGDRATFSVDGTETIVQTVDFPGQGRCLKVEMTIPVS